ncbi:Carbohydrate sulfotransferase 9 [Hondaea fermentalgiana]|uniref:Carbohydrate sulfotransferase 9 n=1 Tax=Hondaea fermentalgiana TaxID=2315210 RepID=A0A2R5G9L7_9STRA|nr:Carbohydrate sulfotransferase 9 [Hondaea fermentalgiana]|eukprot:GBG27736.1 Carbohydrate sulfotransferase 9 [Hondaea fermentalgiana]
MRSTALALVLGMCLASVLLTRQLQGNLWTTDAEAIKASSWAKRSAQLGSLMPNDWFRLGSSRDDTQHETEEEGEKDEDLVQVSLDPLPALPTSAAEQTEASRVSAPDPYDIPFRPSSKSSSSLSKLDSDSISTANEKSPSSPLPSDRSVASKTDALAPKDEEDDIAVLTSDLEKILTLESESDENTLMTLNKEAEALSSQDDSDLHKTNFPLLHVDKKSNDEIESGESDNTDGTEDSDTLTPKGDAVPATGNDADALYTNAEDVDASEANVNDASADVLSLSENVDLDASRSASTLGNDGASSEIASSPVPPRSQVLPLPSSKEAMNVDHDASSSAGTLGKDDTMVENVNSMTSPSSQDLSLLLPSSTGADSLLSAPITDTFLTTKSAEGDAARSARIELNDDNLQPETKKPQLAYNLTQVIFGKFAPLAKYYRPPRDTSKIPQRVLNAVAKFESAACKAARALPSGTAENGELGMRSRGKCQAARNGTSATVKERGSQVLISEPYKLMYVSNMKAASQLVNKIMRNRFNATSVGSHNIMAYLEERRQVEPSTRLEDYFVFTLVRDPQHMFYSAYAEIDRRMEKRQKTPQSFQKMNRTLDFEPARAKACLKMVREGTFGRGELTPAHMFTQVFKTQRCPAGLDHFLSFDFIGKLETIKEDIRALESILGVPHQPFGRINVNKKSAAKKHARDLEAISFESLEKEICSYAAADYACFPYRKPVGCEM